MGYESQLPLLSAVLIIALFCVQLAPSDQVCYGADARTREGEQGPPPPHNAASLRSGEHLACAWALPRTGKHRLVPGKTLGVSGGLLLSEVCLPSATQDNWSPWEGGTRPLAGFASRQMQPPPWNGSGRDALSRTELPSPPPQQPLPLVWVQPQSELSEAGHLQVLADPGARLKRSSAACLSDGMTRRTSNANA